MSTTARPIIDLDAISLRAGGHQSPDDGFCVMELTSFLAHEPWSDAPQCASPVIAAFLRSWNDSVSDDFRQRLKPYAARVIGTRTTDADETTRAWLATDWMVRTMAPAWLELAGLSAQAAELRALQPLTTAAIALSVREILSRVRTDAAAARAAAGDAARAAARAAAGDAAGDAAKQRLAPTVEQLQVSAFDLLDRMIAVGRAPQTGAAA